MPSTIFSGSKVKALKSTLNLNGGADIISSTTDPTAVAVNADTGSLLLNTTSGKLYRKNDPGSSTNWSEVGSGGSGINYITNPSAATNTTGWTTYADAAGSQPVDGTGGSPSVTWTRSISNPLRGSADFEFAKDAVNRQGQGVATDITIDLADQAKVLTVTFDYEVLSGTYATGDLTVYLIADPAGTPVVIQPAGYQVQSATSGTKMKQIATFQTQATGQTYRVCFHVASTSASAYTLAIDNVVVGPQTVQYGAPITDWQDYTPSWIATVTNPAIGNGTLTGKWRRVGDSLHCRIMMSSGTTTTYGSGSWSFTLPTGLAMDSTKTAGGTSPNEVYGVSEATTSSSVRYIATVGRAGSTSVYPLQSGSTPSSAPFSASNPFTFSASTAGQIVALDFIVPIQGWSSTVQMSNDTDTRVIALIATGNPQSSYTANTPIVFPTASKDTSGSYNASTGQFSAPVSGFYKVSAFANTNVAAGNIITCYVGGVAQYPSMGTSQTGGYFSGSTTVYANAGQTIDVRASVNWTSVGTGGGLTIDRVSGPSAIAASETVACRYSNTSGQGSLTNNSTITITGWTQTYDTHKFFNESTGVATIPVSGKYAIQVGYLLTSAANTVNTELSAQVIQAGSKASTLIVGSTFIQAAGTSALSVSGSNVIDCLAGDTLTVRLYHNTGLTRQLSTSGNYNYVSINRIGN